MANRLTTSAKLGTWHRDVHSERRMLTEQLDASWLSPADRQTSLVALQVLKHSLPAFIPFQDLCRAAGTGKVFDQMCQSKSRTLYRAYLQMMRDDDDKVSRNYNFGKYPLRPLSFTPPLNRITFYHFNQISNRLERRRSDLRSSFYPYIDFFNLIYEPTPELKEAFKARRKTLLPKPYETPPPSHGTNFPHLPHTLVSHTLFSYLSRNDLCNTAPTNRTWHTLCHSSAQHTYRLLTHIANHCEQRLTETFPELTFSPLLALPSHMQSQLLTPNQLMDIQYIFRNNLLRNILRFPSAIENFDQNWGACFQDIKHLPILAQHTQLHHFVQFYIKDIINDANTVCKGINRGQHPYFALLHFFSDKWAPRNWNWLYSELILDYPYQSYLGPEFNFECCARLQPERTLLYLEQISPTLPLAGWDLMKKLLNSKTMRHLIHVSPVRTWRLFKEADFSLLLGLYENFVNNLGLLFIGLVNTGYPEMGLALLRVIKLNNPQALSHLVNHDQPTALKKALQTAMEFDFNTARELDEGSMLFTQVLNLSFGRFLQ